MPSTQPSDPLAAERENERREEIARDPDIQAVMGVMLDYADNTQHDAWMRLIDRLALPPLPQQGEAVAWQDVSTAPHARHVLAARFDDCEWVCAVVMSPPSYPFTHWMPLPSMPGSAAPPASQALAEPDQLMRNQAECYRDLHEIATERLGYECILTALEDLDRLKSGPAEAQARVEALEAGLAGFDDEYMTSEQHHPGHVLIPVEVFERVRALLSGSTPKPAVHHATSAEAQCGLNDVWPGDPYPNGTECHVCGGAKKITIIAGTTTPEQIRDCPVCIGWPIGPAFTVRAEAKPAGVEIDDAMVERAARAFCVSKLWEPDDEGGDRWRDVADDVRAALTAALSGDA